MDSNSIVAMCILYFGLGSCAVLFQNVKIFYYDKSSEKMTFYNFFYKELKYINVLIYLIFLPVTICIFGGLTFILGLDRLITKLNSKIYKE